MGLIGGGPLETTNETNLVENGVEFNLNLDDQISQIIDFQQQIHGNSLGAYDANGSGNANGALHHDLQ